MKKINTDIDDCLLSFKVNAVSDIMVYLDLTETGLKRIEISESIISNGISPIRRLFTFVDDDKIIGSIVLGTLIIKSNQYEGLFFIEDGIINSVVILHIVDNFESGKSEK